MVMRRRRLEWFGHVKTRDETGHIRAVAEKKGKRPGGRPKLWKRRGSALEEDQSCRKEGEAPWRKTKVAEKKGKRPRGRPKL